MRRFLAAAFLAIVCTAQAGDELWSGLVLAQNGAAGAKPLPRKLEAFAPTLRQVFGMGTFALLDDTREPLTDTTWLLTSREFLVRVDVLERETARYRLRTTFFHKNDILLSADVWLARGVPLIVRGPSQGTGQLLFLLAVR